MKTIIALAALILTGHAAAQPPATDTAAVIAWKDGWVAYSIDSWAINEYHAQADALFDESDKNLTKIWDEILADARRMETEWDALPDSAKFQRSMEPFWKRGVGLPRRIRGFK